MSKQRVILAAFLIAACFIGTALAVLSLHDQVAGLAAQLAAVQAQAARQHAADETALTAAQARIGGQHRDLITCADLQGFSWPVSVSGTDSYGEFVTSSGATGQLSALPAHCINQ